MPLTTLQVRASSGGEARVRGSDPTAPQGPRRSHGPEIRGSSSEELLKTF